MNQLIKVLSESVLNQLEKNKSNIVRIEGIDSPVIYQGVCERIKQDATVQKFIPKLTREKYTKFVAAHKEAWMPAITYLHQGDNAFYEQSPSAVYAENSYVDFSNAITKWRNESANVVVSETTLILLMGTEDAPDTGGLADTSFVISPKEIIAVLEKDYSAWFSEIIELNSISEEYKKPIHTLYKALFSQIPTDIFKLSDFVDSMHTFEFASVQEIIAHVCETLNGTWGIPSIVRKKSVPKVSALNKGTINSAKIITSAVKFIDRSDDIPSASAINKLRKKFAKYAEEKEIDLSKPFPEDTPVFANYAEFENTVIDFMCGINLDDNRTTLLTVDYAIISEIIGTKLPSEGTKEKAPTFAGTPVEAYSKMFLDAAKNFHDEYNCYPVKITVGVERVSLSDCTDEQKQDSFLNICSFLGGILKFFNEVAIDVDGELLQFEYSNADCDDPFDFANYGCISSRVKCSGKWGDPCKIQYMVRAENADKLHKYEYKWTFSPYASWLNAFSYLADVINSHGTSYCLPTVVVCQNMQDYLDCESEEEFYAHLQQFRGTVLFDAHKNEIRQYFSGNISAQFDLVCNCFKTFALDLTGHGFFNTGESLRKLVQAYTTLMMSVYDNYGTFTDVQKEKLSLLINCFVITDNSNIIHNSDVGSVIVPAYNPIMLEKIDAQQLFLRRGFTEIYSGQMTENMSATVIKAKLDDLVQLSSITQAADAIRRKADEYVTCKNMWEYFGVYYGSNYGNDLLSGSAVGMNIVTDDEDATAMLQNTPMSNIIVRNVLDYVRTFPARVDGLNIAFVAPTDMQHIVSAVHSIAKALDNDDVPATLNIKLICLNSRKNAATYLKRWLDSYFSDEKAVKVNTYLHNSTVHTKADVDELKGLLTNYDLCFTYNLLQSSGIQFDVTDEKDDDINYEKFPMTSTPDTIPATHGKARRVNISQFQFYAAKQHTQASHIAGYPHSMAGTYRVYRTLELPDIQEAIIELAHTCCKWVVCIDQAIDRHMLESANSKIIGFTTGEGSYGELNVTVSARKDILADIKQMLRWRITEKFMNWDNARLQKAADYCVDELSRYMDGSRILKALNPYDYEIHSFLAYILTIQMLGLTKTSSDHIVRALVSLDSYKHWFAEDDELSHDNKRPDFMLIEIPYSDENITVGKKLHIKAKIIECKMGYQNENHLVKAKMQLEKGLTIMGMNWRPDATGVMHRYWLNQLYRAIIFSPLNMDNTTAEYSVVREKIYGILNGEYEIDWTGDIFAFWLDMNSETPDEWDIDSSVPAKLLSNGVVVESMKCHNYGQMFIQKMLLPSEERSSTFTYNDIELPECDEPEQDEPEQDVLVGDGHTIPSTKAIYGPFIRLLADGTEHTRKECLEWYKNHFGISEEDTRVLYQSNGHAKWETVFDFAITDFRKAQLLENSTVGAFHITALGMKVADAIDDSSDSTDFFDIVESIKQVDVVVPEKNELSIQRIGITKIQCDCIVNAANTSLAAGGGVCGAVFREAGYQQLQQACNQIGYCATGEAVITPGFMLPAKYIIHAVGPVWNGGTTGEEVALRNCYQKALQLAVKNGCHSVAFPLISSGIFGYPKSQAWDVAISVISEFLDDLTDYALSVVITVIDDDALMLGLSRLDAFNNRTGIPEGTGTSIEEEPENNSSDSGDSSTDSTGTEVIDIPVEVASTTGKLEDIRVLIGKDKKNAGVYWEFGHKLLGNRHILITGSSGQGKTYSIQTMLLELARQNISSVIFDYTDGFMPNKLEPEFVQELGAKIDQRVALIHKIPVNPFILQETEIPPFGKFPESSANVAGRLADILKHVYGFGDQQRAVIYSACKDGIDKYKDQMSFTKLREMLEERAAKEAKTVLSKMAQFFDQDLFDTGSAFDWKDVTSREGKVTVIQLTGLDRSLQTVITEITLWDAWYSLTKFGNKDTPFVVVLDEAQNLSFQKESPAEKILREGRKYGWSAWFATQFLKGALDSGEISNLQQAAERLYFKPSGEEMAYVASQIADDKSDVAEWLNTVKNLQKGQCIVQGDRIKPNGQFGAHRPTLVSVTSFKDRQK